MAGNAEESFSPLARKLRGPKMRLPGFPPMDALCHSFSSIVATRVRAELRPGIDATVFGFEVARHGDYLRGLYAPSAIYLLAFPQSHGTGLIKAHPRLLGKVLDIYLGGDGSFEEPDLTRSLTAIDLSIYGRFVDLVARCFDDAVRELCGRSMIGVAARSRFEQQPGMVRIAPDPAEIFVIKLNIHIGDDKRGAGLDFVVPVSTLETIKRDLIEAYGAGSDTMRGVWAEHMLAEVMAMALPLRGVVELGEFRVGELDRLGQGDVLELPPDAAQRIALRVATRDGPVTVAKGRLGSTDRRKAVRLTEEVNAAFIEPLQRRLSESE